jgi:predicted ATPase
LLTRLKVRGFKNLVDVDVQFGPFTSIAGANGVGKSNLLDAIAFLSALADKPLLDAALSIRDDGGRTGDVRSLFHRVGDEYAPQMSFEAEMLVPRQGVDDLGQPAEATITF